tara:strand:+ start:312 stop:1175 length:864 start_codon:yes stop_codon:yes gene_type:complete
VNIVGLGQAGCAMADCFSKYPQYSVYKLDNGLERTPSSFPVVKRNSHEEYDKVAPKIKKFVSEMNDSESVVFIMGGSGKISGASLRVLKQLHERFKVHVLYIKPDHTLLNGLGLLQDRACYRVLQEYTRSGVFESMCIVSNPHMEEVLGEVPAIGYYEQLNELLTGVLHWINIFKNTEAVVSTMSELGECVRIYTLGTLDIETGEQKLFFPLNKISDKCYYYGIGKEDLETNGKLFKKIKNQVRDFSISEEENISYCVHPTTYGTNFAYFTAHSSSIQTFPEKSLDT